MRHVLAGFAGADSTGQTGGDAGVAPLHVGNAGQVFPISQLAGTGPRVYGEPQSVQIAAVRSAAGPLLPVQAPYWVNPTWPQ